MPALLSFLAPLIPYILLVFGIVGAYFGVKAKGKAEAKAEFSAQQEKAQAQVQQKISQAVSNDAKIDQKVAQDKAKIDEQANKPIDPVAPGSDFKF